MISRRPRSAAIAKPAIAYVSKGLGWDAELMLDADDFEQSPLPR